MIGQLGFNQVLPVFRDWGVLFLWGTINIAARPIGRFLITITSMRDKENESEKCSFSLNCMWYWYLSCVCYEMLFPLMGDLSSLYLRATQWWLFWPLSWRARLNGTSINLSIIPDHMAMYSKRQMCQTVCRSSFVVHYCVVIDLPVIIESVTGGVSTFYQKRWFGWNYNTIVLLT